MIVFREPSSLPFVKKAVKFSAKILVKFPLVCGDSHLFCCVLNCVNF